MSPRSAFARAATSLRRLLPSPPATDPVARFQARLLAMAGTLRSWLPEIKRLAVELEPQLPPAEKRCELLERGNTPFPLSLLVVDVPLRERFCPTIADLERLATATPDLPDGEPRDPGAIWAEVDALAQCDEEAAP